MSVYKIEHTLREKRYNGVLFEVSFKERGRRARYTLSPSCPLKTWKCFNTGSTRKMKPYILLGPVAGLSITRDIYGFDTYRDYVGTYVPCSLQETDLINI